MQDILTHSPTVVMDDNLKGLLPLLPLTQSGRPPRRARPARRERPSAPASNP